MTLTHAEAHATSPAAHPPRAAMATQALALLVVFLALKGIYFLIFFYGFTELFPRLAEPWLRLTGLPNGWLLATPYHGWSILAGAVTNPIVLTTLLALSLPLTLGHRWTSWPAGGDVRWLRWIAGGVVVLLGWVLAAYDYNVFLNRAHHFDRFAVIALAVLSLRHPAFVPPFLAAGLLLLSQLSYPMGNLSLTDAMPLFDTVLLLHAFLLLRLPVVGRLRALHAIEPPLYLWALLILHASNYAVPAFEKLTISPHLYEWMFSNDVAMHTRAVLTWGWGPLATAGPAVHDWLLWSASFGRLFIQVGTMVLELAGLVLLFRRKLSIALLLVWVAFHSIIFMMSGILFWKWMLLNIGLAAVLWRLAPVVSERVFGGPAFRWSLVALGGLFLVSYLPLVGPQRLGWFDTPSFNTFRLEVVGESGTVYSVDDDFMAPYDHFFAFDRYFFLVKDKLLIRHNATRDYALARQVRAAGVDGIAALRERAGRVYYDAEREEMFAEFLRTYFRNLNAGAPKEIPLSLVSAPHHLVTSVPPPLYQRQEPVARVRVRFTEYYLEGSTVHTILDKHVLDVGL